MTDESNTASQPKRKWVRWVIGFIVIVMLAGATFRDQGGMRLQRSAYSVKSWYLMKVIAVLLKDYQKDHSGNLPVRLSELVPDYIDGPEIFYFASPYTTSVLPLDLSTPNLIDGFTPYGYGQLPNGDPYVFERPGMWADGTVAYLILDHNDKPPVDWRSYRVTVEVFQELLSQNFVPSPASTTK